MSPSVTETGGSRTPYTKCRWHWAVWCSCDSWGMGCIQRDLEKLEKWVHENLTRINKTKFKKSAAPGLGQPSVSAQAGEWTDQEQPWGAGFGGAGGWEAGHDPVMWHLPKCD